MLIVGPRKALLHICTSVCEEDFYTAIEYFLVFTDKSNGCIASKQLKEDLASTLAVTCL